LGVSLTDIFIDINNSILECILALFLYQYIIGKKDFVFNNKLKSFIFLIIYIAFSLYIDYFFKSWINIFIYMLFYAFMLGYFTKTDIVTSIIASLILVMFNIFFEAGLVLIYILVLGKSINSFVNMNYFQLYGGIITRSMQFVFLYFIYKKNISFTYYKFPKKENAIISIGVLQSFIFSFPILITFQKRLFNEGNGIMIYQITIIVVVLLIVILGVIDHKQRENLLKINYQFKIQEVNVKNMENLIQILRKNNHDIGNHLNSMLAIVRSENPNSLEKLKEYIGNLTENLKLSYRSFDTGNDFVNGLLAVKNNTAIESGIKLEVDFEDKLYAINVKDNELVSIVSNIIDNAIYEINKTPSSEEKYIAISGYIVDDIYHLSICNNGPEIPAQVIKKIFEKGYSGKDTKDKKHGYGLYIVKQYVTENGGKISVSSDKDETEFLMKFPIVNDYKL